MYEVSSVTGNKVTAAAAIKATHQSQQDSIYPSSPGGKVTDMPLATTVKNQMLKLLRRSKSTRSHSQNRETDMVIPNKRYSVLANPHHSVPNGHAVAMVDPYPMAMGVVSNGTGRNLPVPEKKSSSTRIRDTPRERHQSQSRRVRSSQVNFARVDLPSTPPPLPKRDTPRGVTFRVPVLQANKCLLLLKKGNKVNTMKLAFLFRLCNHYSLYLYGFESPPLPLSALRNVFYISPGINLSIRLWVPCEVE